MLANGTKEAGLFSKLRWFVSQFRSPQHRPAFYVFFSHSDGFIKCCAAVWIGQRTNAPIKFHLPPLPPPAWKPRALELLKIGSFKFPSPRAKMVFKCPTLSSDFVCQMPLLKNNRIRFQSSVIKLVHIRSTQRHQFKMKSYFRGWLRGTRYASRTKNTY